MNKHLSEIYRQSFGYFPSPNGEPELEKFAQLIIQKCVIIANYAHDGGEYPGTMIKDYFGNNNDTLPTDHNSVEGT